MSRSRIGICMDALHEVLVPFTDQDLAVVHRKNSKGVWTDELWTRKDFKAGELILAPFSSALKESHFTKDAHAALALPKSGRGAHPYPADKKSSYALDGRGRGQLAKKGSIDDEEHLGNLFWLVSRNAKPSQCNMHFEPITWEYKVEMTLPFQKRRKLDSVSWKSRDLPTISVLVNKKDIPSRSKLVAFETVKNQK